MKRITSVDITFSINKEIINPGQHIDIDEGSITSGIQLYITAGRLKIEDLSIKSKNIVSTPEEVVKTKKVKEIEKVILPVENDKPVTKDRTVDSLEEAKLYLNQNERTVISRLGKMKLSKLDIADLLKIEIAGKNRKKIVAHLNKLAK